MAETIFTIDASGAFATLDNLERRLAELEASTKRAQNATKSVFSAGGDLARREVAALDQAQKEYLELASAATRLRAARDAAFDPRAISTYTKAIDGAEAEMRNLERAAESVGVDLKKALEPPKGQGFGAAIFGQLKTAALSAAAGISFGAAISEGIRLNAEYERVRTSLGVILKDVEKADKLLARLNQFAAETPFGTEQINQAATALLAFGESEATVIDRLREIGTISAATGKDFNELTVIYGKARVAGVLYAEDINQLVEAGVPIIQEFAKQMNVSESQVKKLASEGKIGFNQLQTAFSNLTSEGGRFAGLLEAQGQTISGLASTLRDNFSQALRNAFSGIIPIVRELLGILNNLLGATKTQSQALEEERVAFLGVANQIRLTNVGTESRTKLINDLKAQYPQFLGQINAEKATNEQLQPVLDRINQSYVIRIALQKQQEKLRPLLEAQAEAEANLAKQQVSTNQQLAKAAEIAGVNIAAFKTQEEQVKAVTKALQEQAVFSAGGGQFGDARPLNEQARALESLRASQIGVFVQTNNQQQAQEKVNGAVEEQQKIVEQLKKTYGEIFDLATQTPETPTAPGTAPTTPGAPAAPVKVKSATEIAFENREKDIQRRQLLLNDLQDGFDKELETIRLHFDQLKLEYEKAGLDITALAERQAEAEFQAAVNFVNAPVEVDTEVAERVKAAGDAYVNAKQAELERQRAIAGQEIDIAEERARRVVNVLRAGGASEQEIAETQRQFDLEVQRARLSAQLEFERQMLALIADTNSEQAESIKRNIALIEEKLANVDVQIETPSIDGGSGGKKRSLWDFLGIDTQTEEGAEFAAQAEQMAQQVIASIQEMQAARVAAAEAEVDASDQRVDQLEDELDQEIRLAELGFANNVDLKRKQLEEEKKKNAQAREEAEKAKRAQLLTDTAIQASSLITAIANLFKSLSGVPFGAGIPIAIALSAAMLGFFVKSKIDAFKATKARFGATGFIGKDGIVQGRYHAQGGEKLEVERGEMVQVADDGSKTRVEVVRRERVMEYMDLLRAANAGDRPAIAMQALKLAQIETLPPAIQQRIFSEFASMQGADITNAFIQAPTVRKKNVQRLVFGKKDAISVRVDGNDSRQTNELLNRILLEMTKRKGEEKWSADGKTRTRGSVTTKFLN